jgi:cytoskeletal protein RodZ
MKRCPQCSFLYLDTDELCDLDGTPLVQVSEKELEGSLTPASAPLLSERSDASEGKRLLLVLTGALFIGVVMFLGYFLIARRTVAPAPLDQPVASVSTPTPLQPSATPTVTPLPPAEPSPSRTAEATPSPTARISRASVSNNPVSTTANENGTQTPVLIRLNNGARIEADEVWRTKEGVWYRRNGVVTLLKANRVKSIEKGHK